MGHNLDCFWIITPSLVWILSKIFLPLCCKKSCLLIFRITSFIQVIQMNKPIIQQLTRKFCRFTETIEKYNQTLYKFSLTVCTTYLLNIIIHNNYLESSLIVEDMIIINRVQYWFFSGDEKLIFLFYKLENWVIIADTLIWRHLNIVDYSLYLIYQICSRNENSSVTYLEMQVVIS